MLLQTEIARLSWARHHGAEFLYLDFSHASVESSLALIDEFVRALQDREDRSVLLLTNVSEAGYDSAIALKWKSARLAQSAKIRASAVFGLSGLVGMAVRGFMEAAEMLGLHWTDQLKVFKAEEEAKEWLCKQ